MLIKTRKLESQLSVKVADFCPKTLNNFNKLRLHAHLEKAVLFYGNLWESYPEKSDMVKQAKPRFIQ